MTPGVGIGAVEPARSAPPRRRAGPEEEPTRRARPPSAHAHYRAMVDELNAKAAVEKTDKDGSGDVRIRPTVSGLDGLRLLRERRSGGSLLAVERLLRRQGLKTHL